MTTDTSASAPAAQLTGRPLVAASPVTPDAPARAGGSAGPLAPLLQQFRAQPRLPLILGGAVLATAIAAAVVLGRTSDYRVLYANISDKDGGAIVASLQQMNVPYKLSEGGGAIMVPADRVSETRLKLAGQGLPKAGGVGFELLDNQKFGTSQFGEQVNYQRGLEGEIARSIESISSVESARVHLALPKNSLFVRDQKKPSASVVLTLHRGRTVDEGQVNAIVHMISSSVPDLEPKSVTVVDQRGNLLSSGGTGSRSLDGSQLKYAESVEQSYVRRIEGILQPLMGPGNVRAQVAADIDFNVVESTDEKYRPNQEPGAAAIRSQQSSESAQQGSAGPGGVPGALSNQPPAPATAPLTGASTPSGAVARSGTSSSRKDTTTNYELDRSIKHTQQAGGITKRLSVAVVVNHREVRDEKGQLRMVALTAAEMDQVRDLVKEAMGFNQARGDSLNVVNSLFSIDNYVPPEVPVWKDPQYIEVAKDVGQYLLAALALLVVWLVFRPKRKRDGARDDGSQSAQAAIDAPATPALEETANLLGDAAQVSAAAERESTRRRENVEYAQETATKDPALVATLVRHWMAAQ